MSVLISLKDGKKYEYKGSDFNSQDGLIKKSQLKKTPSIVKTSKDVKYLFCDTNSYDLYKRLKRGPQIITLKDAGYMLLRSGVSNDSVVWEAGSGSGAFTIQLSKIVKKVITYEREKRHYSITKKNLEMFDVSNVFLENKNAYEKSPIEDLSHIFLDLKSPWRVSTESLNLGGVLVIYVPTVNQISEVVKNFKENFLIEEVSEIIKRDWKTNGINRPKNTGLMHTGFLMFLRKVK